MERRTLMVMYNKIKLDPDYAMLVSRYRAAKREVELYEKTRGWHKSKAWSTERRIELKKGYLQKIYTEAYEFMTQAELLKANGGASAQIESLIAKAQTRVYTANHHKKVLAKLEEKLAAEQQTEWKPNSFGAYYPEGSNDRTD